MIAQKATPLCIYEILKKYSDENHIMSAEAIREKLKKIYDVDMERRAIYRNMDVLRSMGIEIEGFQDNRQGYYLMDRQFEQSEVRLLCDAVASSDLIKEEMGKAIIKKLIETQSIFQGRMLQKTIFVKHGEKAFNRQLFYNIDALNVAISQGCKVSAELVEYDLTGELEKIQNSAIVFSPYVTFWVEGNYYILAKQENIDDLEHFRIDRIKNIRILERGVDMIFGGINPQQYAQKYIIEKGENKLHFDIECKYELWQDIAEKFGHNAIVVKKNFDDDISVRINTVPSKMKAWVLQHLSECEVTGPRKFRDEIQDTIMKAYKKYCR